MKFSLAAVSVSYEKHSSPSDDHSDTHYRCDLWNWELWYIGMIFVVCLGLLFLGSPSLGEEIKVPSWKMGMKEFSKCVKPGHFKSVSSVSRTMWVRRFDLAICGNFFPIFVQALKCPSSGTLRVFITFTITTFSPNTNWVTVILHPESHCIVFFGPLPLPLHLLLPVVAFKNLTFSKLWQA